MFKKWRFCLSLLVCLSCILSTLFLDILEVNASSVDNWTDMVDHWVVSNGSITPTYGFRIRPNNTAYDIEYLPVSGSGTFSGTTSSAGYQSGSFSYVPRVNTFNSGVNYYNYHLSVPVFYNFTPNGTTTVIPDDYYGYVITYANYTVNGGVDISNFVMKDSDGQILASNLAGNVLYLQGRDLLPSTNNGSIGRFGSVEFDVSFSEQYFYDSYSPVSYKEFSISPTFVMYCGHLGSNYQGGPRVSDKVTQQELGSLNQKQDTANAIAQDTNTKATNFFNSFFDNLLHIFVPEDGFFSSWFNDLNTLLSSKLGFLYAPFDVFFSLMNALLSADTAEAVIPFPEISWDGTTIVESTNLKLSDILGNNFDSVRSALYFLTDLICILAVFSLMRKKLNLILRGDDNDS